MSRCFPSCRSTGLALLLLLGTAGQVAAHALGAECTIRQGRVEVEAYYSDDTPAREARVRVLDDQQKPVAEGRTDEQGRWSFPVPPAANYQVIVDAGAGHRKQLRISVPEQPGASGSLASSSEHEGVGGVPVAAGRPQTISEGPTREEFTRFPWLKVSLGLAALGGFSLAVWLARQGSRLGMESQPERGS
jgi:nickel transport protein